MTIEEQLADAVRERDEARASYEAALRANAACDRERAEIEQERDEARAERAAAIARITEIGVMVAKNGNEIAKGAYRRGAEAMREACIEETRHVFYEFRQTLPTLEALTRLRALPIPEET